MGDKRVVGRLVSIFAAGFVATAALVGSAGTLLTIGAPSVATAFAANIGPVVTFAGARLAGTVAVEAVLSVIGGAIAAAYFGKVRE